ncbi:hypothetical protein [Chryseobacterium salviniae]|uniref:Uncharacterized protein n=1 Tax=Chryseobacterium salviniae TaxID=3101750 RepID=A0ABU6HVW9_9FLAO|nr:hypothetical protein [Chryseobacterium sp. T9W2-O]MEC3877023.1 hypothetical protein [Chryseobacterium sp. T9W2-O]
MNVLLINAYQILTVFLAIAVLYAAAIAILFKNRAGILHYLALILFPVVGPLGIVVGNCTMK